MYLGRVLALYILARAFAGFNLNDGTYAVAPAWMRFLADDANELCNIIGLWAGICALLLLGRQADDKARVRLFELALPFAGALTGFAAVALLNALDEVRYAGARDLGRAAAYAQILLMHAFFALFIRANACALVKSARLKICLSAVLQAGFALAAAGGFETTLFLNALIWGALCAALYEKKRGVFAEIALAAGFYLGHRLLAAYPGAGAFYVEADVWTGGDAGLYNSVLLTAALMSCALLTLCRGRLKNLKRKTDA